MIADVDPDIHILYYAAKDLIAEDRLRIRSSLKYNRKLVPDINLSQKLDQIWRDRLSDNPRIWNGTKFRFAGLEYDDETLTFNLGVTCYKDFLTTNWPPYASQLKRLGSERLNKERAYLSDAMGVGALVVSRDKKVVLLRRSHHVAEAAGWLDVPGGHSEPEMLVGKKSMEEIRPEDMDESEIRHEIFDSIIREITDEVNIPADQLSQPWIMGVAANNHSSGRPSVEFLIRCELSADDIISRYHRGNQAEADESTSIVVVDLEEVSKLQNSSVWRELAPSAKGCFHLYYLTRP